MKSEDVKGNLNLGLSPRIAEMILMMDVRPEAKLVLMAMIHHGVVETSFHQLSRMVNCPNWDLDFARLALSSDQINVNKINSKITFNDVWKKIVEENKNVQLHSRANASSGPNVPNNQSSPTEASVPANDAKGTKPNTGVL